MTKTYYVVRWLEGSDGLEYLAEVEQKFNLCYSRDVVKCREMSSGKMMEIKEVRPWML